MIRKQKYKILVALVTCVMNRDFVITNCMYCLSHAMMTDERFSGMMPSLGNQRWLQESFIHVQVMKECMLINPPWL